MGWSVYKHTLPNGKVYIGITSKSPSQRWNNGLGYQGQRAFFKEIVAFGWNNIEHEVICSGLSEADAREMERTMIEKEEANTLNTQMRVGYSLHWKYTPISEGDNATRKQRFSEFADYWLEKAKYRENVPFTWDIGETHLDLTYYTCEQNSLFADVFRVTLPPNITYEGLYKFLTYECDFSKAEHIDHSELGEVA